MRYAGIKYNDTVDCDEGLCVSFWTQGCPHHCLECHNPETWDFDAGLEVPADIQEQIIQAIGAYGIKRDFSVLGGEPLCPQNKQLVCDIIKAVRAFYPNIKIYLLTGYTLQSIQKQNDDILNDILNNIDILVDGPYIKEQRNITLRLRGSENQHVYEKGIDF